jgi:serine/threonine protein kinase
MELKLIGQTLGKYRILEEIGRGGMGVVYKAHDTVLDRLVAIKVLAPHLTWDQEFVQRFRHEARAAARLKHPYIVTIYDVGQAAGHHFIVMDYLEGQALSTLIRRGGPLPPERAVRILVQVAQALDYAHAQGLVHRDVKPGNVIVSPQDQATLTDFGVARSMEGTRLTQSGVMIGTPAYMSPEQVKGRPVGPAADVYALGVVTYEMLGGRPPFEGDTPHVLYAHAHETPPPLPQVNRKVSPAIAAVVQKALAKDPTERYLSAGAFAAALQQAAGGIREPESPAPPLRLPSDAGQAALWPVFGALGAVLLVLALAFSIGRSRGEVATPTPTATLTATPVLTSVPTKAPTPTITRRPTPKPSPTSNRIVALVEPVNGTSGVGMIAFRWAGTARLRPGEVFDVRVCKGEGCQPKFGKTNTSDVIWHWCPDWVWVSPGEGRKESIGSGDVLRWQVVVIDEQTKQDKGPKSEVWQFVWQGGMCGQKSGKNPQEVF